MRVYDGEGDIFGTIVLILRVSVGGFVDMGLAGQIGRDGLIPGDRRE